MERVTFLIERTGDRISCLLNPESLEARRTAGLARRRTATGGLLGNPRSDDPLIATGGGITEYDIQLLFDIDIANEGRSPAQPAPIMPALPTPADMPALPDSPEAEAVPGDPADPAPADPEPAPEPVPDPAPEVALADDAVAGGDEAADAPAGSDETELPPIFPPSPESPGLVSDVRELTQPLWALAETGEPVDGALVQPRIRFIWGKSWNVPGVILAVAERLECFDIDGVPRRSWLSMRIRRVEDDPEGASAAPPISAATPQFQLDRSSVSGQDISVERVPIPVGPSGMPQEPAYETSNRQLGSPAYHLDICDFSGIDNPHRVEEGQCYIVPPLGVILARRAAAEAGQWAA